MGCVRRKCWERFFWFVLRRGLSTDFKRWRADTICQWLGLIFVCGGADGIHGNGWRNVGAAAVEGVGINVDGVAMAAAAAAAVGSGGDDDASVDDVGGVDCCRCCVVNRIGVVEEGGGVETLVAVAVIVET